VLALGGLPWFAHAQSTREAAAARPAPPSLLRSVAPVFPATTSATSRPAAPTTQPTPQLLPWLSELPKAQTQAQQRGQPILLKGRRGLVRVVPAAGRTDRQAAPQKELGRWTLVYLDGGQLARPGNIAGHRRIPATRILTPTGRVVASQEGYLPRTSW